MTSHPAEPSPAGISAVRGPAITFTGDPFVDEHALVHIPDALILSTDGMITAFGPWQDLEGTVPQGVPVDHYPGKLLCAGFVDAHIHYVQTGIIGAFGGRLLDWLEDHTFVEEQRFADPAHAAAVAELFFDQLLANGTTTAVAFAATYPGSVDAFFAESLRRGTRMIGGKVLMDRHAPAGLLDTAERGYRDSAALIDRWHGTGRNLYAITPRFAPTSSREQLAAAGQLRREHPDVYLHTHVSENLDEVRWVRELFPERDGYLDVYDHYGLLGPRTVLAHGVHLTDAELRRVHRTGAMLVHCPTSNLFLGSGLFDLHRARTAGAHLGLGTDVGAGTGFSLLTTMNEAYKVAALRGHPLHAARSFYLATLGAAEGLGLADRIGSLAVGKEADFVVLDPAATPLLEYRSRRAESLAELLFVLSILGDDRAVAATYVQGRQAHRRTS